ncbi:MAG: glutathione ABC transporter permease GsiC [Deltaproteobacteria bacterium]|nr:MAG: glutathione ABC transporter permease GsiC [Deltaproteobacteria bacterium]
MLEFALKRAAWASFVMLAVITIVFMLVSQIGDPCAARLGANARPEQIAACHEQYGFDQPLTAQYGAYLGLSSCVRKSSPNYDGGEGHCGILQGDLGESMRMEQDVVEVILTRLPRSMLLGAMAMGFEVLLGVFIGIIAATRRNTWFDTGVMATAFVGISAPTFLSGLLFLYFFAFRLGWFPVGGYGNTPLEHIYSAILPAFTLAIIGAATYARIMRSEMVETLRADYVRTAKAKGLGPVAVIMKHGARNALLPIVTLMGLQLAILVSGAIITESIFAWPGVGRLAIESIHNLDAPIIMGVVIMVSFTVQFGNFLADVAVGALDPRVRVDQE